MSNKTRSKRTTKPETGTQSKLAVGIAAALTAEQALSSIEPQKNASDLSKSDIANVIDPSLVASHSDNAEASVGNDQQLMSAEELEAQALAQSSQNTNDVSNQTAEFEPDALDLTEVSALEQAADRETLETLEAIAAAEIDQPAKQKIKLADASGKTTAQTTASDASATGGVTAEGGAATAIGEVALGSLGQIPTWAIVGGGLFTAAAIASSSNNDKTTGPAATVTGVAAKGLLDGATVFFDFNGDGVFTEGVDPFAKTSITGKYSINLTDTQKAQVESGKNLLGDTLKLVVSGGTDVINKTPFTGSLSAIAPTNTNIPVTISVFSTLKAAGMSDAALKEMLGGKSAESLSADDFDEVGDLVELSANKMWSLVNTFVTNDADTAAFAFTAVAKVLEKMAEIGDVKSTIDNLTPAQLSTVFSAAVNNAKVAYESNKPLSEALLIAETFAKTLAETGVFAAIDKGSVNNDVLDSAVKAANEAVAKQAGTDTIAPTVTSITMSDSALKVGDTSTVTVTFSEKVTAFDKSDVTAANGSVGDFASTDGGQTWTATFTPTTNIEDTSNVITVAATYTDLAGNAGTGKDSANYTVDTKAPTVTSIAMSDSALKVGDTSTVTVTFSEKVTAFDKSDVTAANGSVGDFASTDGGQTWTATFTPTTNIEDTSNVITVAATYTDLAGNAGTVKDSDNYTVDTKAPTVTSIEMGDSALKVGDTSTVTVTFSEKVTGFDKSDVTAANGSVGDFASTDGGQTWTATFTPKTNIEDTSNVITVAATYTDLAGNAGTGKDSDNYTVDTKAPSIDKMDVVRLDKTIKLTFSESLDNVNAAPVTAFNVLTVINGQSTVNPVASITVQGNTVTLVLTNAFSAGQVDVSYTDPTVNDDPKAVQDTVGNDAVSFKSGIAVDGYIRGAKIYIDTGKDENNDGTINDADYFDTGITTNVDGNFFLTAGMPVGGIVVKGGINIDTGVPNTTVLKAPAGSTTVNPLTTLVQEVMNSGATASSSEASAIVAKALGLPPGVNLTSYDPYAVLRGEVDADDVDAVQAQVEALAAQKAAAKFVAISALASKDTASTESSVGQNLAKVIVASGGGQVNFSDSATLSTALGGFTLSAAAQSNIADAVSAINESKGIEGITAAQSKFLDTTPPAAPVVSVTAITNNTTNNPKPTVNVAFNSTASDGTAVVIGDQLALMVNGVQIDTVTINASQLAAGSAQIALSSALREGDHQITAQIIDQAGNASVASNLAPVNIDLTKPVGLLTSATAINSSGSVQIQSSEAGFAYLVNNSLTVTSVADITAANSTLWKSTPVSTPNSPMSLSASGLADGSYTLYVVDAAGNLSAASTKSVQLDSTPPSTTATISNIKQESGEIAFGGTSQDNTLTLTGINSTLASGEVVAIYDGSSRIGTAKIEGTAWSFDTSKLTNANHTFTVRVEDLAGNKGVVSEPYSITVNADFLPVAKANIDPVPSHTNDVTPSLTGAVAGTLVSGDKVVVYDGNTNLGVATVTGNSWSFTPPVNLGEGVHQFSAYVQNSGGNLGDVGTGQELFIDATPPTLTITSSQSSTASGPVVTTFTFSEPVSGFTIDDVAIENGSKSDFSRVSDTIYTLNVTPNLDSNAPITISVAEGSVDDLVGNKNPLTTFTQAVDTLAPTLNVSPLPTINAANMQAAVVTGTAEAGATITLDLAGNLRSTLVDQTGAWQYTLTNADYKAMGQGTKPVSITATDILGNKSAPAAGSITIDTVAPTLTSFALASESQTGQGVLSTSITRDNTPSIKFTAETGANISVSSNGVLLVGNFVSSVVADQTGISSYTFTPTQALSEGVNAIQVRVSDAAGNVSTRTGNLTIDTTPPVLSNSTSIYSPAPLENQAVLYKATVDNATGITWGLTGTDAALLKINALGVVSLKEANSTLDFETKPSYSFTIQATDAAGNKAPELPVTVNVTNLDEVAPTIEGGSEVLTSALENQNEIYQAKVTDTDTGDFSAGVTLSLTGRDANLLQIDSAGKVTLKNGMADFESKADYQFNVIATDAAKNATTQAVTVNVGNIDEVAPTFTSRSSATVSDGAPSGTVVYSAIAVDSDFTPNNSALVTYTLEGTHASAFSINANTGVVTLKDSASIASLPVYKFDVIATDAAGNKTPQAVTLAVQTTSGENLAPIVTSEAVATWAENTAANTILYQAEAVDPNAGDSVTFSLKPDLGDQAALLQIDPVTGEVSLKADAKLDYELHPEYTFTVIATDSEGKFSEQPVTIKVTDQDELAPVIAGGAEVTSSAAENQTVIYTASVADSADVSGGFVLTLTGADADLLEISNEGKVTLKSGTADFEGKSSYSFNIVATDAANNAATQAVTVNVINVDEAATGTLTVSGSASEGGSLKAMLTNVIDPDGPTTTSYQWQVKQGDVWGNHGNPAATLLIPGDESFVGSEVRVVATTTDSQGGKTIFESAAQTIAPVNDPAIFAGDLAIRVSETNSVLKVGGTVTATDVDGDDNVFKPQSDVVGINGLGGTGYGKFSITENGVWTYITDGPNDVFEAGKVYTDSFTVFAEDGTPQVITVSIVGTSDDAIITGTSTATLTESNDALSATGTLSAVVAGSVTTFVAQTNVAGSNGHGKFSIGTDGVWTYTTNSANDAFVAGQTYTDSLTVATADGTPQVITVNIAGTNDAAVITGTSTATLTESNVALSATGTLSATDVDSATTFVAQTNVAGSNGYGKFSITEAGGWTYTTNSANDAFVAGQTYTDSLTVATADGTPQVITVSIAGTNDAPVAIADSLIAQEDVSVTYDANALLGNDSDIDLGEGKSLKVNSVSAVIGGAVALNPDGTITFTPAANFNGPASFTYTVIDKNGGISAPATATVNVAANHNDVTFAEVQTLTSLPGTQTSTTLLIDSSNESGQIGYVVNNAAAIGNNGLGVDFIDFVDGAGDISWGGVNAVDNNGMTFVGDDVITLALTQADDALDTVTDGTVNLNTNLASIAGLGIDSVAAAAGSGVDTVNVAGFGTVNFAEDIAGLSFADALTVNLNLTSADDKLGSATAPADGIVNLNASVADLAGVGINNIAATAGSGVTAVNIAGFGAVNSADDIADLSFADGLDVNLALTQADDALDSITAVTDGTVNLNTNLASIAGLGIDSVAAAAGSGVGTVNIAGFGTTDFADVKDLFFVDELNVNVSLNADDDKLDNPTADGKVNLDASLAEMSSLGIDQIMPASGVSSVAITGGLGLESNGSIASLDLPDFSSFGIGNAVIDLPDAGSASIGMDDTIALLESGLSFAMADDINLSIADGTILGNSGVSLEDLGNLGIDSVSTANSVINIDAADAMGSDLIAALSGILDKFETQTSAKHLFEYDDVVTLNIGQQNDATLIGEQVLNEIALLGIDFIQDMNANPMDITGRQNSHNT